MHCDFETPVPENLRRWQASGDPFRWVATHRGQWNHQDWLDLLADLSPNLPGRLDRDAVEQVLEDARQRWRNLQRWQESGAALAWVEAHQGQWNHGDWLALLGQLRESDFWPVDPDEVGLVLEGLKVERENLRRWQESGEALAWVEAHQGQWNHDDWLELLEMLKHSEFWPLAPAQIGALLEEVKRRWGNLRRWQESGDALWWVRTQEGEWDHDDWLALVERLRQSEFWPLDTDAVGLVLEETRRQYRNLRRWQESGAALRWIQEHQGEWSQDDWLRLLEDLRRSDSWPLDAEALRRLLQTAAREWKNLQHWQESGAALEWVQSRGGRWDHGDWLALLGTFQLSGLGPVDPEAVGRTLEEVKAKWAHHHLEQHSRQASPRGAAPSRTWDPDEHLSLLKSEARSQEKGGFQQPRPAETRSTGAGLAVLFGPRKIRIEDERSNPAGLPRVVPDYWRSPHHSYRAAILSS